MERRSFIKGAGTVGVVGIAGCSGNGGNGNGNDGNGNGNGGNGNGNGGSEDGSDGSDGAENDGQITLATASSGSSSQAAAAALSRATDEHSDELTLATTLTRGWSANPYLYDNGEAEAIATDTYTVGQALEGAGSFAEDPIDTLPGQGFHFSASQLYMIAVDGTGIESTADINESHNVYPTQPGFGARALSEDLFERAGLAERVGGEYVNIDVTDAAGAIEEGRIDALVVYGGNSRSLTGWATEVDARTDVHLIEYSDEFQSAIGEIRGVRSETLSPDDHGWQQDVTEYTDDIITFTQDGMWWFGPEVHPDETYELARISHEHNEFVRESDPEYPDHTNVENMTFGLMEELPVHKGVAQFYKDNDIWEDSWTEGNEYEL